MKQIILISLLALSVAACTTTEARLSGVAAGAGTGALIGGPIGAVAGGAVGLLAAPSVVKAAQ